MVRRRDNSGPKGYLRKGDPLFFWRRSAGRAKGAPDGQAPWQKGEETLDLLGTRLGQDRDKTRTRLGQDRDKTWTRLGPDRPTDSQNHRKTSPPNRTENLETKISQKQTSETFKILIRPPPTQPETRGDRKPTEMIPPRPFLFLTKNYLSEILF